MWPGSGWPLDLDPAKLAAMTVVQPLSKIEELAATIVKGGGARSES